VSSRGSAEGFESFITTRGPHFLKVAIGLTGSLPAAEDLLQTAAERLWRRWRSTRGIENPDAYLRTMLVNLAIDQSRRAHRRPEIVSDTLPERGHGGVGNSDVGDSIASTESILGPLRRLPPKQRAVVVLRILEDLDTSETARALGVSPGTVKSNLSRALESLRADYASVAPRRGEPE
jgi:RNA polymerase sigma-70 factor (sigma-E family)